MVDDVLLNKVAIIEQVLARIHMVGFRNVAVHQHQRLSLPILRNILHSHLDDFATLTRTLLTRDLERP